MGFGRNIHPGFSTQYKAASNPIDPAAQTLFDAWAAAGVPANTARKTMVNNTIIGLKNAGIWSKIDSLQMYVAHAQGAALIDWKKPSRVAILNNAVGTTFVVDQYIKGNNTSTNIDTQYNPGDGGGPYNFTQNNNFYGVYFLESKAENKTDLSTLDAGGVGYELDWFPSSGICGQFTGKSGNATTSLQQNILNPIGFVSMVRTGATSSKILKNGFTTVDDPSPLTSAAVINRSFKLLARDTNGVFSNWSTKKIAYFCAGDGTVDNYVLNNIISANFLNPLGVIPQKRVIIHGNSYINGLLLPARVRVDLGYPGIDFLQHGTGGYTTAQLLAEAPSIIFNLTNLFYTKNILVFQEFTNGFTVDGANAAAITSQYNEAVQYCTLARAAGYKVLINTMYPRGSIGTGNLFRQNDSNLLDNSTLNGLIRNTWTTFCDGIVDGASDPIMGIWSQGVPGVGELNT